MEFASEFMWMSRTSCEMEDEACVMTCCANSPAATVPRRSVSMPIWLSMRSGHERDPEYRDRSLRFHFALRDVGFKVIEKPVQWYTTEEGIARQQGELGPRPGGGHSPAIGQAGSHRPGQRRRRFHSGRAAPCKIPAAASNSLLSRMCRTSYAVRPISSCRATSFQGCCRVWKKAPPGERWDRGCAAPVTISIQRRVSAFSAISSTWIT